MKIDETETVSYPEDNLVLTAPVHVTGELVNAGPTVVLKGEVNTSVKLCCGRCLKEFDLPLRFRIEEEYINEIEEDTGEKDVDLSDNDFVFEISPDNTINLSEAVRQDIITELPIQPLCDEKCPDVEIGASEGGN